MSKKVGGYKMTKSPYYFAPKPLLNPRARIFCFPYAGGTSSIYFDWPDYFFSRQIEVVAVSLPGRGARFGEPFDASIEAAITNMVDEFLPYLDRPFYLYGHSNGALYCYEFARQLLNRGQLLNCRRVFLGAKAAPRITYRRDPLHLLNETDFRQALAELGGTPQALLADEQLLTLLSPMLRADFKLGFDYMSTEPQQRLQQLPTTLIYGTQDVDVGAQAMSAWRELLPQAELESVAGGHFFIHHQQALLVDLLLTRIPM
ncbi:hypothetical protein CWB98_20870 [Pseudoalteromonas rubra]|uniref:Thioesterase domain-containing protein n=2 Tax=Pseudoalteromonas rubra TaxID=43658 RepID=A0A5S3WV61_9GAMM|nr:hypothetical protein CWB98_20870 [Pseudoalteromonas rubra]